ncbi:Acetokinase family-domain-containing protein [Umbelopsis sp. PMI_123]|nr:Acetokinase family-domain-containing protein [Umbelopsis sp. PMI_123]
MPSVILVLNAGSSSLKFKLFICPDLSLVAYGSVSEIGTDKSHFTITASKDSQKVEKFEKIHNHSQAMKYVLQLIIDQDICNKTDIKYVGHRIVHGGDHRTPANITKMELEQLDKLNDLAPLHNSRAVNVIRLVVEELPESENVACFDTMYHQTIPEYIYTYPVPKYAAKSKNIRKYGFHGLSHSYVAEQAAKCLNKPLKETKLISLHLGSGSSVCAILHGKSLDTSMGLTPLSGLPGATRSGDIDPSAIFHFIPDPQHIEKEELSRAEKVLNKESGISAICGTSNISEVTKRTDSDARLALDLFVNRIQNFIGAYFVALQGVDAIIFTGGIGENSEIVREKVVDQLNCLGCKMNREGNQFTTDQLKSGPIDITGSNSVIKVFVIATNEEYQVATAIVNR